MSDRTDRSRERKNLKRCFSTLKFLQAGSKAGKTTPVVNMNHILYKMMDDSELLG